MNNPIGTLTPAYGRDYKSKASVIEAFEAGKDFALQSMYGSTYVNRDAYAKPDNISIRYDKLRKITVLKWKGLEA